jgi:hypothetical protein
MSLGCFECRKLSGSMDKIIIYHPSGIFNPELSVLDYDNFYTCCLMEEDVVVSEESRFAFLIENRPHDYSIVPNQFSKLRNCKRFVKISESWLKENSPRTYSGLLAGNG